MHEDRTQRWTMNNYFGCSLGSEFIASMDALYGAYVTDKIFSGVFLTLLSSYYDTGIKTLAVLPYTNTTAHQLRSLSSEAYTVLPTLYTDFGEFLIVFGPDHMTAGTLPGFRFSNWAGPFPNIHGTPAGTSVTAADYEWLLGLFRTGHNIGDHQCSDKLRPSVRAALNADMTGYSTGMGNTITM